MNQKQIDRRIETIKKELGELGRLHPGSVSKQYNICGTPGCACKKPKNPQKHGPYYNLSYTSGGRHSTRFVRPDQLDGIERKIANHRGLRDLIEEWVALSVEQERQERATQKKAHGKR